MIDANMFGYRLDEVLDAAKDITIPRDKLACTILDIRQRPKALDLQFEQKVCGVEGFRTT
jgi:hypothetical protein